VEVEEAAALTARASHVLGHALCWRAPGAAADGGAARIAAAAFAAALSLSSSSSSSSAEGGKGGKGGLEALGNARPLSPRGYGSPPSVSAAERSAPNAAASSS
jgi:hypothetical protein